MLGSGELVRSLHAAGLVDRYAIFVYPIVLGSGTRLFGDSPRTDLRLDRTLTSGTGVVVAEYSVVRA